MNFDIDNFISNLEDIWLHAKNNDKDTLFENLCRRYQTLLQEEVYIDQRKKEIINDKNVIKNNILKIFSNNENDNSEHNILENENENENIENNEKTENDKNSTI